MTSFLSFRIKKCFSVCDKWMYFVWWSYQKSLCHQQDRQSSSFILFNHCKTFALRRSRKPFAAYARTLSTKGGTDVSIITVWSSCMDPGLGKPSFTIVYCFRIGSKCFRDVQLLCSSKTFTDLHCRGSPNGNSGRMQRQREKVEGLKIEAETLTRPLDFQMFEFRWSNG